MQEAPVVVLTREHEDNLALIERLDESGIESMEYPCIKTRIIPYDGGEICEGKKLEDFKVVTFTSKRGVAGMNRCKERLGRSSQVIAVVGRTTADAVAQHIGRRAEIVAHPQTGEGLARAVLTKLGHPEPVLHVRGNMTSGKLKQILEDNGFEVCELIVYENVPPDLKPLELERPVIAVFASPSAAQNFFQANPRLKDSVSCVAIGPITEEYLKEQNLSRVDVAVTADSDHLAETIRELIKREFE